KVLSEDGKSYVFDERAKGFVLGEGAGLLLLKDYEAAVRDHDRILATILGSAVNNDGKTMGVTVPNKEGQKAVIQAAIDAGGITPDTIGYLEAHGTGTLLGDPIEIKAATEVYKGYTDETGYCAVGSVKSNLGHTMTAAGVISLIKVILSLQHRQIPATLHCRTPHPRFKFDESPFYPNTQLKPWHKRNGVRRAAVSSFGFGGTNCHMILEQGFEKDQYPYSPRRPLPATPFKRKWYWLGQKISEEQHLAGNKEEATALSGSVDTKTDISKTFSYDEPLLKDHRIFNERILMGVAHLSLQLDYIKQLQPDQTIKLDRILFSTAVMLNKNDKGAISVFGQTGSGTLFLKNQFSISPSANTGEAASAQYVSSQSELNRQIDIAKPKAAARKVRAGNVFYEHSQQETYGESLYSVKKVWDIEHGVFSEIMLTETMMKELSTYYIHPCVFDACHVTSSYVLG
ncbi:MAG: hypothetical protein GY850_42325, partial [bacterium]|nr:hypothetical protein [bacterium]